MNIVNNTCFGVCTVHCALGSREKQTKNQKAKRKKTKKEKNGRGKQSKLNYLCGLVSCSSECLCVLCSIVAKHSSFFGIPSLALSVCGMRLSSLFLCDCRFCSVLHAWNVHKLLGATVASRSKFSDMNVSVSVFLSILLLLLLLWIFCCFGVWYACLHLIWVCIHTFRSQCTHTHTERELTLSLCGVREPAVGICEP